MKSQTGGRCKSSLSKKEVEGRGKSAGSPLHANERMA
jgi:hypothetical protein